MVDPSVFRGKTKTTASKNPGRDATIHAAAGHYCEENLQTNPEAGETRLSSEKRDDTPLKGAAPTVRLAETLETQETHVFGRTGRSTDPLPRHLRRRGYGAEGDPRDGGGLAAAGPDIKGHPPVGFHGRRGPPGSHETPSRQSLWPRRDL